MDPRFADIRDWIFDLDNCLYPASTGLFALIDERRASGRAVADLLGMLLDARDEATGEGMTREQLRDEVMTIFVADHETTANAMAWLLYLVAQHPEVKERLLAEIHAHGEVLEQRSEGNNLIVRARLPERLRGRLEQAGAEIRPLPEVQAGGVS